jgi:hypothetical protein
VSHLVTFKTVLAVIKLNVFLLQNNVKVPALPPPLRAPAAPVASPPRPPRARTPRSRPSPRHPLRSRRSRRSYPHPERRPRRCRHLPRHRCLPPPHCFSPCFAARTRRRRRARGTPPPPPAGTPRGAASAVRTPPPRAPPPRHRRYKLLKFEKMILETSFSLYGLKGVETNQALSLASYGYQLNSACTAPPYFVRRHHALDAARVLAAERGEAPPQLRARAFPPPRRRLHRAQHLPAAVLHRRPGYTALHHANSHLVIMLYHTCQWEWRTLDTPPSANSILYLFVSWSGRSVQRGVISGVYTVIMISVCIGKEKNWKFEMPPPLPVPAAPAAAA